MAIQIDVRQMVLVIASAVDLVGIDDVLHGRRVAIMAVECAKVLGWDTAVQNLLFDAGLLHDAGVSSTRVHRTLVNEMDWSGAELHCDRGYELIKEFTPLAHLAPIIRHHHDHWEELAHLDVNPTMAHLANLIYLADRVDVTASPYYADNSILLHIEEVCSCIKEKRGTFFSPKLVDAFLEAARAEAFWLILNPDFIPQYVTDMAAATNKQEIGLDDLKRFALIIAEIVDAKSHFTTEHSLGVGRLARYIAENVGIVGERIDHVEIAALLHDIGKLQVPDEVLDSPRKLTLQQWAIMKKHSFATYQILKRVVGLEEMARWAAQHHESLNGTGYPFHMQGGELPLEARIIKIADIYSALAQNRPYRKAMAASEILDMLRGMQAEMLIDPQLVEFVAQHLGQCHAAATAHIGVR